MLHNHEIQEYMYNKLTNAKTLPELKTIIMNNNIISFYIIYRFYYYFFFNFIFCKFLNLLKKILYHHYLKDQSID